MEMAKFENRFLTPIQGFTQSKIEKAKIIQNGISEGELPYRTQPSIEKVVVDAACARIGFERKPEHRQYARSKNVGHK